MVTNHRNHNTLDNKKGNLANITKSENQQNRKGVGAVLGGISWDEKNQDWVVVVKGKYYGRFKEIEKAKELANK